MNTHTLCFMACCHIVSALLTKTFIPVQRLDDLDEQYVNVNLDDGDFSRAENHHQGLYFCSHELPCV
jgi:hypothetical protein